MWAVEWMHRPGVTVRIFEFDAPDVSAAQKIASDVIPKSQHRACKVIPKEDAK